jgi:hypothetical protein
MPKFAAGGMLAAGSSAMSAMSFASGALGLLSSLKGMFGSKKSPVPAAVQAEKPAEVKAIPNRTDTQRDQEIAVARRRKGAVSRSALTSSTTLGGD